MIAELTAPASVPAPAIPVRKDRVASRDKVVSAFVDILTKPRSRTTLPYLESILSKAQPLRGPGDHPLDPLLSDLLRFTEDYRPDTNALLSAELGNLLEAMVKTLIRLRRPDIFEAHEEELPRLEAHYKTNPVVIEAISHGKPVTRTVKWKTPDFLLSGNRCMEMKYNFASCQNRNEQIAVGTAYASLGKIPIFLNLKDQFKFASLFEARGWTVYMGQDAIDFLKEETGLDFRDLLHRTAAHPRVAERMSAARTELVERWSQLIPEEMEHVAPFMRHALYDFLAGHEVHALEMSRRLENDVPIAYDRLTERSEKEFDRDIEDATPDDITPLIDLFRKQDPKNKNKLLDTMIDHLADPERKPLLQKALHDPIS